MQLRRRWNNNAPVPSQQFTRIDDVSYGIVVNLTAGRAIYSYLSLETGLINTAVQALQEEHLLADGAVPGSNTPAPATSGTYQIVVNFQTGTYTVTPYTTTIPANLYIVGDATAGGWDNPVPVPAQQFTRIDAVSFGIIVKPDGRSKLFIFAPEWKLGS